MIHELRGKYGITSPPVDPAMTFDEAVDVLFDLALIELAAPTPCTWPQLGRWIGSSAIIALLGLAMRFVVVTFRL